jgi:hypothetical protein
MEQGPRHLLKRVAGTGCAETLLCTELKLPRPAAAILEFRKTVLVDQVDLTPGNVLVQGRLRVGLIFPLAEPGAAGRPLWSMDTDVAFTMRIALPEAAPGMECRVLQAHVSGHGARADLQSPEGAILSVADRSVVFVSVRVLNREEVRAQRPTVVAARPGHASP